jgi:hypothetical protein
MNNFAIVTRLLLLGVLCIAATRMWPRLPKCPISNQLHKDV